MTGGLVVLLLIGFGIYHAFASTTSPEYSIKDIRQVINKQYPGEVSEPQLNEKESFYESVVENEGNKYSIKVDANTGEVLELKLTEQNTGANAEEDRNAESSNGTDNDNTNNQDGQEKVSEKDNGNEDSKNTKQTEKNVTISLSEAKEIALERFPGNIEEAELDEDDGRYLYEINIVNGDKEAEIEIDAFTGEILYQNIEVDDD